MGSVTEALSTVNWDFIGDITVFGIIVFFMTMFFTNRVVTRATADNEKAAIISGYAFKDQAHESELAYKSEQIEDLRSQMRLKDELLERREMQLSTVLNEMAPTLAAWEQATQRALTHEKGGNDAPSS